MISGTATWAQAQAAAESPEPSSQAPDAAIDDLPAMQEPGDAGLLVDPLTPMDVTGERLSVPDKASTEDSKEKEPHESWRDHRKLRILQTKFEADPKLVELRELAASAPMDSIKRQYLTEYYDLLFSKIEKADPTLAPIVQRLRAGKEEKLVAVKIIPSVVPGSEAPSATPAKPAAEKPQAKPSKKSAE